MIYFINVTLQGRGLSHSALIMSREGRKREIWQQMWLFSEKETYSGGGRTRLGLQETHPRSPSTAQAEPTSSQRHTKTVTTYVMAVPENDLSASKTDFSTTKGI